jgi:hypothetical protein
VGETMNLVREPDAGNPPVRFDEREVETEHGMRLLRHRRGNPDPEYAEAYPTAPPLDSTRNRCVPGIGRRYRGITLLSLLERVADARHKCHCLVAFSGDGRGRAEGATKLEREAGNVGIRLKPPREPGRVVAELAGARRLKPYWGKPTVRNFREAAGNVTMGGGMRPNAKALETPPHPTVRAPVLYPTEPSGHCLRPRSVSSRLSDRHGSH